ncbi:MAG: hypothetical protein Q7T38_03060 [Gallionella sp.]|nr:hypothetical protein [Gallionella sp.]
MTYSIPFLAVSFIFTLLFLHSCAVYWQERKEGRSHEASVHETIVATVFFAGSATIQYFSVVSHYA